MVLTTTLFLTPFLPALAPAFMTRAGAPGGEAALFTSLSAGLYDKGRRSSLSGWPHGPEIPCRYLSRGF